MDAYIRKAVVTKIVDGDTFDAITDLGYNITIMQRYRVLGINAPELKGSSYIQALTAKKFLENTLLGIEIYIESKKTDVYGRYLARVIYSINGKEFSLAEQMLKKGLCLPYGKAL